MGVDGRDFNFDSLLWDVLVRWCGVHNDGPCTDETFLPARVFHVDGNLVPISHGVGDAIAKGLQSISVEIASA